jgi:hypothetical protein
MASEVVSDLLPGQSTTSRAADFLGLTEKDSAAVVVPVAEFVPYRKASKRSEKVMLAVVQEGAPLTGSLVTRRWSEGDSNSRSHPVVKMWEASLYFDPHELS